MRLRLKSTILLLGSAWSQSESLFRSCLLHTNLRDLRRTAKSAADTFPGSLDRVCFRQSGPDFAPKE